MKSEFSKLGNEGAEVAGPSPDYEAAWQRIKQELRLRKRRHYQRRVIGISACCAIAVMLLNYRSSSDLMQPMGEQRVSLSGGSSSGLSNPQSESLIVERSIVKMVTNEVSSTALVIRATAPERSGGGIRVVRTTDSDRLMAWHTRVDREVARMDSEALLEVRHSQTGGVRFLSREEFLSRFQGDSLIYFPNSPLRLVWIENSTGRTSLGHP